MSALKSLNFAPLPAVQANPTLDRRTRTIAYLEEQKLIIADPTFTRKIREFVVTDGVRTSVEKAQRVRPWWQQLPDGSCLFTIRSGLKPIEFEKGKAAIAVPSQDRLPAIIDTLITAVRSGELDTQLAHSAKPPIAPKRRPV